MNIHFGNQSQFELFPGTTGEPIENTAPRFIFSRIVLTFDNVVVVLVFIIVSLIIAFSVGVERGRVKARLARPVAQITASAPVLTSVMPNSPIVATAAPLTMTKSSAVILGPTQAVYDGLPAPAVQASVVARPAAEQKGVDKGYTVQVASYKKESMAAKEAMDLKRQGLLSFILGKGNYTIVCIGKFSSQDEAKQMLNKLKKRYKDSMIRSF